MKGNNYVLKEEITLMSLALIIQDKALSISSLQKLQTDTLIPEMKRNNIIQQFKGQPRLHSLLQNISSRNHSRTPKTP
jgi:hypothetical protein